MLQEKLQLISELDEKILNDCEVDDVIKEVEDAEFFKMRLMNAIANISTNNTPSVPKMSSPQENKTIISSIPPAPTSTFSDSPTLLVSTSTSNNASNQPASSNASIPPSSTSPSTNGSTFSIHHHLTRTPIRQFQRHGHRKRDHPRLYWQSSKEMLRNFEVSGIALKAQCTQLPTSRRSTSSITVWCPCWKELRLALSLDCQSPRKITTQKWILSTSHSVNLSNSSQRTWTNS